MIWNRLRPAKLLERSLFGKFLLLFVPLFTVACAAGLVAVDRFESAAAYDRLTARVGNKAARIASSIERFNGEFGSWQAQALLDTLLSDLAFSCGEVRIANGGDKLLEAPKGLGCTGQWHLPSLSIPVGEDDEWQLTVRFSLEELTVATKLRRELTFLILLAGVLLASVASWIGFRRHIGAPLSRLLKAISEAPDSGTRHQVPIFSRDEIAVVTAAYNGLQMRIAEFSESLEQRVAERSAAALRAAEDSQTANQLLLAEVAERRRIEAGLRKANTALEKATQVKSQFLATMSHEIRTPMNGVFGMLNLLGGTKLDERQMLLTRTAQRSAEALLAVINDILDFSKLEAGRVSLENLNFDIVELLEEVCALFRTSALEKALSLDLVSDCPRWVVGDPTRLRQLLINLVGNAVKFTKCGGISIKCRHLQLNDGRVRLRLEIADTGIGIPEEARSELFSPFVQANSSTSREFGGTGLGLSISKQIVNLMDGDIGVESREGFGSTFWFEIEVALGEAPIQHFSPIGSDAGRRLRILVVEDNPVNQLVAEELLSELGHQVEVVADGRQAVDSVREQRFDVVLMDVQMPVMDGLAATRAIRKLGGNAAKVPIVALTANATNEDRAKCLAAGMNEFVSKPFEKDGLIRVIAAAINDIEPHPLERVGSNISVAETNTSAMRAVAGASMV